MSHYALHIHQTAYTDSVCTHETKVVARADEINETVTPKKSSNMLYLGARESKMARNHTD